MHIGENTHVFGEELNSLIPPYLTTYDLSEKVLSSPQIKIPSTPMTIWFIKRNI